MNIFHLLGHSVLDHHIFKNCLTIFIRASIMLIQLKNYKTFIDTKYNSGSISNNELPKYVLHFYSKFKLIIIHSL
jgi:hypothetical protein